MTARSIQWHMEHRTDGKLSRFMEKTVGDFCRVARDYLKIPYEQWQALARLRQAINPKQSRNKREISVSLAKLDEIGLAEMPKPPEPDVVTKPFEQVRLAQQAQRSLFIRLLVRRPMRSRNIREMKIGHNLYEQNGQWVIEFQGSELKVDLRAGRANTYRLPFPQDLVPQLKEFLHIWRPLLPGHTQPELFTTRAGQTFTAYSLNEEFKKTVFAYTGKAMHIHLVRDVWASEYFASENDITTAAAMLGDTIETVMRIYLDPRSNGASDIADRFVQKATHQPSN